MSPKLTKKIREAIESYFKEKEETLFLIEVRFSDFPLPEDTVLHSGQEYSIPRIQYGTFSGKLLRKDGLSVEHRFDIWNMKIRFDNQIIDFQILEFGQLLPPFNPQ